MKLLVVGSGGREHAIAKKLLESKDVEQVFVAPGNDGMTLDGLDLINIGISEHSKLIDFAKANDIAWTFIGPDDALAAGIVDDFNAAGLKALYCGNSLSQWGIFRSGTGRGKGRTPAGERKHCQILRPPLPACPDWV